MRRDEFNYPLPVDLIAQYPLEHRGDSRLLCLDRANGEFSDRNFPDLLDLLQPGDLLVFNDTRVIPARLFGNKETGGKVEIMVERILGENQLLAQMRFSKAPRRGSRILLEENAWLEVLEKQEDMFVLKFNGPGSIMELLDRVGHIPLPPYIDRGDKTMDRERYQTVYAKRPGAVAAPTAGLHFSAEMMNLISKKKIRTVFVTLHVGAGTFQPVRSEIVEDHHMHSEYLEVSTEVCALVQETRAKGGRVIAVGTTAVRSLETAALSGTLQPYQGETSLFITPGFPFRVVDALVTNFHLPESTLLMLVCAFAGRENVLRAYQHAIAEQYRFFSYGDAMFIHNSAEC